MSCGRNLSDDDSDDGSIGSKLKSRQVSMRQITSNKQPLLKTDLRSTCQSNETRNRIPAF